MTYNLRRVLALKRPLRLCYAYFATANELVEIAHSKKNLALNVLKPTVEDLSDVALYLPNTFNIAAYVNKSDTLKNLININVDLSKIEKKPHIFEKILKLDFERDIKPHIFFLNDYMNSDEVAKCITKNPLILTEAIEDLTVRINYLQSKKFTNTQIENILSKNPFWLSFSTQRIDRRLGFFQEFFELLGAEVRMLATKQPKIITYNLHHIKTNNFVIKEEMGFSDAEIKSLLLSKPRLWLINQRNLYERFNFLHNEMQISHEMLLKYPQVLECRKHILKQRHLFLEKLGRGQYDPKKENYVPLLALAEGTDVEFCKKHAKCTVSDFNIFLKTL